MNSDNTLDIVQALGGNTPGSSDLSKGEAAQRLDLASAEALLDFATGDPFAELDPAGLDETTRSLVREISTELHRAGAAAASAREAPIEVGDKLVALRRLPLHTTRLDGAMPPWSAGMAAEHHIGPLSDRTGRLLWIDVFRRVRQYRFVRSAGAPPFLTLPIVQFGLAPQAGTFRAGATFDVAAGSLWLATNLFAATPTNTYSGIRISGGSIRFTADVTFGDEEAVVPLLVGVDLTLQFAPPVVEMPARGSEFAETQFEPPEGIAVSIRAGAATIAVQGTAKLAVWGSEVELAPQAATPHYQAELNRLVVPMKPDVDSLEISHVASMLFVPSGQARIRAAGLALPAAVIAPENLGEASGVGALMLAMNAGLVATWQGERRSVRLGETLLLLDGTRLSFTSRETRAENDVVRLRLPFSEAAGLTYTRLDKTSVLYLTVSNGAEWVTLSAAVDVRLPKPVDVTGGCLGSRLPQARLVISSTVGGERTLLLSGLTAVLPQERPAAFALTNAVLRVTRPRAFLLVALLQDDAIAEGLALTAYGMCGLLPSLPDPYATNTVLGPRFDARSQGYLISQFAFRNTGQELRFALPPDVAVAPPLPGPGFAAPSPTMDARGLIAAGELARAHGDIFEFEGQSKIILVDVSTNASRFGVAVRPPRRDDRQDAPRQQQALHAPQVQGLDLAVDGRMLVLLTLPSVQWEPVRAVPGPEPFPDEVRFANSGVPTTVDVPSVELIPVNPLAAYDAIVENFAQKSPQASRARFTLPFGMLANARLSAPSPSGRGALVSEVRPSSADLKGAHQLRIVAADPRLPSEETPALPGFTVQLSVASPTDGSGQTSILGSSVNTIFNLYLGAGQPTALVPVTRIDLSGHGESLFSNWANPDDPETGVSKAEFQVVNGRAAKEVVQVKSVLLPYFVPVVRTITLGKD